MTAYAYYDLAVSPASFDVMAFLVMAKDWANVQGERLHVVIVPGRYDGFRADHKPISVAEKQFRLHHVLLPMCHAIGATATVCADREQAKLFPAENVFPAGYSVDRPIARYSTDALIAYGKTIGRSPAAFMPSMRALDMVDAALMEMFGDIVRPVVITLRETYVDARNSDVESWIAFATYLRERGEPVVIVRDTDKNAVALEGGLPHFPMAAIETDIRLALYERAYVNMAVSGGPVSLNLFSARRPYLMFKMNVEGWHATSLDYLRKIGLPPGSQMPWAGPHQRITWTGDSFESLVSAYHDFCRRVPVSGIVSSFPEPLAASSRIPLLRDLHAPDEIAADTPLGREIGGVSLAILLDAVKDYVTAQGAKTVLDYGCGRALAYRAHDISGLDGKLYPTVESYWSVEQISLYDPAYLPYGRLPKEPCDVVLVINLLERLPECELAAVLADIFRHAQRGVFFAIAGYLSRVTLADGTNLVCTLHPGSWWRECISTAARDCPACRWTMLYLPEDPLTAAKAKRPATHEKYTG